MAHVQKFCRSAVGHMLDHYDREHKSYSNENIDFSKTCQNYNLAEKEQPMKPIDFLRKRLSEVKVQNRKDVNVMCDWVLTAPKDLPAEELESFFKASYDFFAERYGRQNVVSANVHMDEVTPHMHFAFVPVTEDKKKGGYKVSAKEVLTRTDLRTVHNDLKKTLENALGHSVSVLNGVTDGQNKTINELKAETAEKRTERAEERLKEVKGKILNAEQVNAIEGKKSLTGALKNVSYEDFLSLKKTAALVDKAKKTVKQLQAERDAAVSERDKALESRTHTFSMEKMKQMERTNELERQNKLMKNALGLSNSADSRDIERALGYKPSRKEKNRGRGLD